MSIECPECKKNDEIRKIEGIYFGLVPGQEALRSSTHKYFSPPVPIDYIRNAKVWRSGCLIWAGLSSLCGLFEIIVNDFETPVGIITITVCGLIYWGGNRWLSNLSKKADSEAVQVWKKMFYCSRDHLVFNPDDNSQMAPEDVKDYLIKFSIE